MIWNSQVTNIFLERLSFLKKVRHIGFHDAHLILNEVYSNCEFHIRSVDTIYYNDMTLTEISYTIPLMDTIRLKTRVLSICSNGGISFSIVGEYTNYKPERELKDRVMESISRLGYYFDDRYE